MISRQRETQRRNNDLGTQIKIQIIENKFISNNQQEYGNSHTQNIIETDLKRN